MKLAIIALLITSAFAQAGSYTSTSKSEMDILVNNSVFAFSVNYPYDSYTGHAINALAWKIGPKWAKDFNLTPEETKYYVAHFVKQVMDDFHAPEPGVIYGQE
jgi:hypothetical protein